MPFLPDFRTSRLWGPADVGISCTGRARAVGEVPGGTGDDVGYDQADGEVCESPGHLPHHPLMWCHARSARRRHMS